jgi:hypothetical protein
MTDHIAMGGGGGGGKIFKPNGPKKTEKKIIRVVKVMGEDVGRNPIIEKLTKKYSGGL